MLIYRLRIIFSEISIVAPQVLAIIAVTETKLYTDSLKKCAWDPYDVYRNEA